MKVLAGLVAGLALLVLPGCYSVSEYVGPGVLRETHREKSYTKYTLWLPELSPDQTRYEYRLRGLPSEEFELDLEFSALDREGQVMIAQTFEIASGIDARCEIRDGANRLVKTFSHTKQYPPRFSYDAVKRDGGKYGHQGFVSVSRDRDDLFDATSGEYTITLVVDLNWKDIHVKMWPGEAPVENRIRVVPMFLVRRSVFVL